MFLNTEKDICALATGDDAAFCRLYEKYKSEMYRYAYSIIKDYQLAEDVVQDAFIQILEHSAVYIEKNEKAWIMRIVHNLAVNRVKKKVREECTEELHTDKAPSDAWFYDVMKLIRDETDRQIVILKIDIGLKLKEIADILNLTPNAVSKRYRKTLKELKEIISRY